MVGRRSLNRKADILFSPTDTVSSLIFAFAVGLYCRCSVVGPLKDCIVLIGSMALPPLRFLSLYPTDHVVIKAKRSKLFGPPPT